MLMPLCRYGVAVKNNGIACKGQVFAYAISVRHTLWLAGKMRMRKHRLKAPGFGDFIEQ